MPLYFNFMMTKRRSRLLFEIRQLKKSERVFKFYSDEEGCITVKGKEGDRNKRITDIAVEGSGKLKTWTVEELLHAFPLTLSGSGGVFRTRITGPAHFDPFGVKIERLYFVTFPNYTQRPF